MTNPNPSPETRFKKGDPRIWKHGRPKSFDALRAMALEIANEKAMQGDAPIIINGHAATAAEVIMRRWAQSKDPRLVQAFVAYAFGKVPEEHEVKLTEANIKAYIGLSPEDWDKSD
jgi:hypothetical protein